MAFKFAVINPLLHNELRLKIMVALSSLESADFVYLCQITDSTRGNLSVQISTLREAGYIDVTYSLPTHPEGTGGVQSLRGRSATTVHAGGSGTGRAQEIE